MPKRSNSFQRLIKLLHERLDKSWRVTESRMFEDSLTGEGREVDIVLESVVGAHTIIISVECRDHKRKADTPWIESMAKKHESLPTSKLVLWSASGFYKPALEKAKKLNIDTVSHKSIDSLDWARLANQLKNCSVKILNTDLSFFVDVLTPEGVKKRLDGPMNYLFKEIEGERTFRINDLKNLIANNSQAASVLLDHATPEKSDFWIEYIPPVKFMVLDENGVWNEPFRIGVGVKAFVEETTLDIRSVLYDNKVSTLATGQLKTRTIELFIEEKANSEPNVVSRIFNK